MEEQSSGKYGVGTELLSAFQNCVLDRKARIQEKRSGSSGVLVEELRKEIMNRPAQRQGGTFYPPTVQVVSRAGTPGPTVFRDVSAYFTAGPEAEGGRMIQFLMLAHGESQTVVQTVPLYGSAGVGGQGSQPLSSWSSVPNSGLIIIDVNYLFGPTILLDFGSTNLISYRECYQYLSDNFALFPAYLLHTIQDPASDSDDSN